MSKQHTPIVIYHGPSVLDHAPIVVLATVSSTNTKTGPMVQTWIMRADTAPTDASKQGLDGSVCGQCPRRHSLGGDCYVTIFQAPRSVWAAWDRSGRPDVNYHSHLARLSKAAQAHGLRLGSYGDPAAVPYDVWRNLIDDVKPRIHTGYTHQWAVMSAGVAVSLAATNTVEAGQWLHMDWCRRNLMASCDSGADLSAAILSGWRAFYARRPGQRLNVAAAMVECPATRLTKRLTCEQCGICNGAQDRATRASVYLDEHGARSNAKHKRSTALRVV